MDTTIIEINPPDTNDRPGIAAGSLVNAATPSSNYDKQIDIVKLSNRYFVTSYDFDQSKKLWPKVAKNIEHTGQTLLAILYKEDWRRGTDDDKFISVLVVSATQEVWAAEEREGTARWIAARDLIPGRHVLKQGFQNEKGPWAEIVDVKPPPPTLERYQNAPVHELVLIDSESFKVSSVLCRTSSVPAPPPVKQRVFKPFKDFPLINFTPQRKTLRMAQAEIWYRQSAALLPRCIAETTEPLERVRAMLALKHLLREVAAKATAESKLRDEFIRDHPLPTLEELVPNHQQLAGADLARAIAAAIDTLAAPGARRYSEFVGGMESYRVYDTDNKGYREFDGEQWVLK